MNTYRPPGKLTQLHEEFIDMANRPMSFADVPVKAREAAPIIVASEKWEHLKSPECLTKSFKFRRPEDRIRFVTELMEYEMEVQHHAEMLVAEDEVSLKLATKDVDAVTERDREYAVFADSVFKDIVYQPTYSGSP